MRRSVALGLAAALAACANTADTTLPPEGISPVPTLAPPYSNEGMAAEVKGTVWFGPEEGCVWLEAMGIRYPVVFPSGTVLEDGPPRVLVLPDGRRAEDGDRLSGAGGYLGPAAVARAWTGGDVPPCLGVTGEVAVFNNTFSGIEVIPRG
jgi:hypothetical protein